MATTAHTPATAATARGAEAGRRSVPWKTVLAFAVPLAYADGYWLISLRGAVGAIERTDDPFGSWLRESTVVLPVFVFAVLAALTLGLRWFGAEPGRTRTVVATALLIAAAGTITGIAALAASSAYDYHLQSAHLQTIQAMPGMGSMQGHCDTTCLAQEKHATLTLHLRGILLVSRWLPLTNLALVAWVVAIMGGRLNLATARRRQQDPTQPEPTARRSRAQQVHLLLVGALAGTAAIHAAVIPQHLTEWAAAGLFFLLLTAGELTIAGLLLTPPRQRTTLLAATAISLGPLLLWLYSRAAGMPFGPEPGTPEPLGVPDCLASTLEIASLLAAIALLHSTPSLRRRSPLSPHHHALTVAALIAVTTIGIAGAGLGWFNPFEVPASHSSTGMHH